MPVITDSKPRRAVIIFSSLLLPPSQTFVRDPAEKFQRFTAYYVGSRRIPGLDLPEERVFVVNRGGMLGKVRESLFKLRGRAPYLYRQIQALQPALIHAQFGLSGVLVMSWAHALGIPLLVHYRGADATVRPGSSRYTSLNHWIYFRRLETLKRQARLFLTVSKFLQQKLLEQGFPEEKILTHYHGVDLDCFRPDPAMTREPIVLFVGRLTEKKGCEDLIQAMAQVQAKYSDATLVLIGDGPLRRHLEALAATRLQRYRFLGFQSPAVVKTWMNRARVLAAPSVTSVWGDAEGLPNVILEAHAMHLPVVSTLHAGIPEAVRHGETGFLTAERDVATLARYILDLLENDNLWQCFSEAGRRHMEACFDRVKQTRALEDLYEAMLRGDL